MPNNLKAENFPVNTTLALSESSYINSNLFQEWFKSFPPVMLLLDGHKSHSSLEGIEVTRENNTILFCLPPYSIHLYQTLDVAVFSSMKLYFKEQCAARMRKKKGKGLSKTDFGKNFKTAWNCSMIADNLEAGFKATKFMRCSDSDDDLETTRSNNPNTTSTLNDSTRNANAAASGNQNATSTPNQSATSNHDGDVISFITEMLKPFPVKKKNIIEISKRIRPMNKFSSCSTTDEDLN